MGGDPQVAPAIHGLLDSACDRLVDPNDAVDCRLVVRCSAAFIRRHHNLAPERAAAMVVRLAETAGSVGRSAAAHRWQRFMALQALRSLLADPSLLYRLYHLQLPADKQPPGTATMAASTAGKSMEANGSVAASPVADGGTAGGSGSVVHIIVASLYDALRWYVRTSIETPEDDVVAALGNLYFQRAMGARDAVQETEAFGTNLAHGSEVVIAHLALECVLAMVAATEALTDVVVVPAEPGMPSPKLITRDTPEVRCADVAGLVLELWRCVLNVCNTLLARAGHDVLVGLLVRGMQGVTYSAGALGVVEARDALLHALCAHTLLPPGEDDVAALAVSMAGGSGGAAGGQCAEDRSVGGTSRRNLAIVPVIGSSSSSTHAGDGGASSAPGFLTALLVDRSASSVRVVLTPRNIAALRALFNIAHRLADGLGSCGWLYVVDAVNALDRILASPHTTTAAYLVETGGEGEVVTGLQPMNSSVVPISGAPTAVGAGVGTGGAAAAAAAGVGPAASAAGAASAVTPDGVADDGSTAAQRELRILASAADQLFENTHHMSPEAVVSLLSALADISHRTLAGLGLLGGGSAAGGIVAAAAAAAPPPLPSAAAVAVVAVASTGPGGGGVLSPSVGVAAAAAVVPGAVRLCALNRMVDTLLHNLWRVQDLWGIFLAHVLEALASNNMQVRAAAVDALDRTITGALNPDLHVPDKFTAPLPALEDALSPAAAVAARKALLPNFPSYATTAIPSPAGGAIGTSTPGSRRSSKDMAFGLGAAVGMTTPISSPQVSLHPSTGRGISGGGAGTGAATSVPLATFTVAASPTFQSPTLPRYASGGGGATPAFAMGRHSSDLSNHLPPLPTGPPPPHPSSLASAASPAAASSSPFARSLTTATIAAVTTTTTTTTAAAAAAAIGTPGSNAATIAAASPSPGTAPPVTNRGVQQSAQREDVQHMLLVALDSLYREGGRSPDVRHGLLRIALHVLQHHGDGLTRGWVPLLRLLDAVPRAGQGSADVRLGFQVVELLATDYLASSLPKEHVAKALEVIAKFATQDTVLNVSLSSITMLWNVTDHLARSRGTFSKAAATQHQQGHHHHQQQQQQKHPHPVAMMTVNAVAAAASPTPAAATVGTPPPRAPTTQLGSSSSTRPIGGGSSGAAAAGSSPFSSEMYGSDTAGDGEKQMSPAFAAALSFARGVPSLPSASSPERSPWVQQQQPQARPDAQLQQGQPVHQQAHLGQAAGALAAIVAGGAGGAGYPMHDLDEAESIAMLMIAFRSLKALSVDPRPEARNAAVRTLFLAVGSHGGKFPSATWHELFWSLLFDLLLTIHRVSSTSSVEEAAAVELGKEKGGRPVVMLVHHSRNSEQKQWDETLVLALGGAAKVMRSYMAVLSGLDVWTTAWEQLMQLLGELLATGRKAVCLASTSLLTTVLQAHGSGPLVSRAMWQQTLAALDRGVNAMAAPNTSAPLQARAELLTCITTISSQLLLLRSTRSGTSAAVAGGTVVLSSSNGIDEGGVGAIAPVATNPDPEQLLLILRWLDRFARYPVGADDTSSIHFTTIGPIQKSAMAVMAALPPAVSAAGVWPAVLAVLCNMLRPFSTLALRQYAQLVAALLQQRKANSPAPWSSSSTPESSSHPATSGAPITASTGAASGAGALDSMASYTSAGSSREPSVHGQAAGSSSPIAPVPAVAGGVSSGLSSAGSGSSSPWLTFATSREVMEARALSPLWMARVVELLAAWYRDQVSWQVRVATFPLLVGAMSECMACRHLLPQHQPQSGSQHPEGPQAQLILAGDLGEVQALEELWRAAARGFVTVVQTGLPSINICSHQGQQPQQVLVPHSTWPALARAFQMFFLATNLPPLQQPPQEAQHALSLALAAAGGSSATASYFRRMSTCSEPVVAMGGTVLPPPSPEQIAADFEITMAVLDCLSETVLGSCQHAPIEVCM
ncbi:hypothetical protein Vretifemale_5026 [Volvox reticuliferus]|uniref:Mon2 C-terminal domain-containing protein n=1 Tax=Volvox reticuliferus TaxID=1737510 RepID=A0A8J4C454_9CHLO|nr:hypothetical protein Vretifemale_5026 [Volvox reticuliferus]